MPRKKIILFVVEGITEKIALGLALSSLLTSRDVQFQITDGDLTTKNTVSQSTIKKALGKVVKDFIRPVYEPIDILEVVHLVDIDGAFIDDSAVKQHYPASDCGTLYTENFIYTNNVASICARNAKKRAILNLLVSTSTTFENIPYRVYFFSCNLDHVLHADGNLSRADKVVKAEEFRARYAANLDGFIEFIKNPDFAVSGDYLVTWSYIKQNNNSLKRHSNFHVFPPLNTATTNTPSP